MEHRVYYWHTKALRYCNKQMRPWLLNMGITWDDFLENGALAEVLISSGNSQAIAAVRFAESTGWSKEPISVVE